MNRRTPASRLERRLRADVAGARRAVDPRSIDEWIAVLDHVVPADERRFRLRLGFAQVAALLLALGVGVHLITGESAIPQHPQLPPPRGEEPAIATPPVSSWIRAEDWKSAFDRAISDERSRILMDAERVYQAVWSGIPRRLLRY